jgi:long-subunit fatty acid transport protein
MMTRSLAAAGLAAMAAMAAQPLHAQSLYNTRGLGAPAPAVDARAATLGGVGVGLIGFHTSMVNPAELAGLTRRGVSAVLQPVSTSAELDGVRDGTAGTRFPVLRIIYPVGDRVVASLGYGSWLEQSWSIRTESTQQIGAQEITVTDVQQSVGGIAQLRLGASYRISPTLSVGAAAGLYTGNVERVAARGFTGDTLGTLFPFEQRMRWTYLAPLGSLGVRWDLAGVARFGASATFGGALEAEGVDGPAEDRSYGAPMELAAGASARINPLLTLNGGAVWSRPPATEGTTISRDALRVGAGLEYQGVRSGARTYPIRLGGRWEQLPYHLQGEAPAEERSVGLGFGFRLGDPGNPAAVADIGLERAERTGLTGGAVASLDERLWRFTLSLSLFGN